MPWPYPPTLDAPPLQRYGIPEYIIGANPAAGAHFVFTVDGGQYVRPVSIGARLVTDGNAASREVVVQYRDSDANVIAQNGINTTVPAGQTADYFFSAFQPEAVATVNASALVPLQAELLSPTWSLRIFVVNVQVGDQLSRIRMVAERFYSDVPLPGRDPDDY